MILFKEFIFVGLGGFIGAVARYGFYVLAAGLHLNSFPLSTLAVNVLGSFLIGFLSVFFEGSKHYYRLFIVVGMLGGFTTFSSFSHETMLLFQNNQPWHAMANVALNIMLCLVCVFAGFKIGKLLY